MKALVTGAGGLFASALLPALAARGDEVLALRHEDCDVTRSDDIVGRAKAFVPDWIFHCAAWTRVDECEANEERAQLVNGLGSRNAALAAVKTNAGLITLSTDYIFDGAAKRPIRTYDPVSPLGAYGRSKWAGEQAVREVWARHLIVRTAWLFGAGGTNFVDTVLARARGGEPLAVVDDQRGSPTSTLDLATQILRLLDSGQLGTFHCTNSGDCTWHQLAEFVLARAGVAAEVKRLSTAELGRPAPRPAYSVLDNDWTESVTGHVMPRWEDAVKRHLDEVGAAMAHGREQA